MRRYQTDRYGMISSFDVAEALRRSERRRLDRERVERERAVRKEARAGWFARLRALVDTPRRSTA
jgi:hypothetical protein